MQIHRFPQITQITFKVGRSLFLLNLASENNLCNLWESVDLLTFLLTESVADRKNQKDGTPNPT